MKFKRAISITIDNFVSTYKLLLYHIVTGILFFGLSYTILTINLNTIIESAETKEILRLLKDFFLSLTAGNVEGLQGFQDSFLAAGKSFLVMLKDMMLPIVLSLVGIILLYIFSRMVNGLATFTVAIAVDNRMETYGNTKFSTTLFSNFGKAVVYQLIYIPLSFLYTAITAVITWFLFFYALSFVPLLFTILLAVTAVICLQALKFTLISAWLPLVIRDKKKVGQAFRLSIKNKKRFWNRFSNFLVCLYLVIIVNVVGALCTLGSFLFLSIPLSYLFVLSMQFVCYFEDEGKKYFIGYNQVVNDGQENVIQE